MSTLEYQYYMDACRKLDDVQSELDKCLYVCEPPRHLVESWEHLVDYTTELKVLLISKGFKI